MAFLIKLLLIVAAIGIGFFVLTFTVYFLNLDMKMMAVVEPWLDKIYDHRKRERKL